MIIFLALRNISRNKKDSFIIAALVAVITFLFFIGNSIITKANIGIQQAFVESLTGDVVLEKSGDVTMNLFGANTPIVDEFFTIPTLPAYDAVMEIVCAEEGIEGITSQVSGKAFMDLQGVREPVLLCGIDPASYFSLFPGIVLEEGRYLQPGEYGAMITAERAQRIAQKSGRPAAVGTPVLLTSGSTVGFKIREVPLVGIFRYQNPGQFMNEIVITDPQTVRVLNSIQVAGGLTEGIPLDLLNAEADDLFMSAAFGDDADEPGFSADMLQAFLRDPTVAASVTETGGDWNFIMLRLKKGISPAAFIASLNKKIEPYGIAAVNWRTASGTSAILALLLQALFNAGIFLVSVVGVVAVINILLISVFRRVREIGTLRAIGASDLYIRSLIYCENIFVALLAGFAGVAGGFLFFRWVNSMDLHISNTLVASVLNGSVLHFDFLPQVAVFSFFVAVVLALAATIYPVEAAVRIEPVVAVQRG